MTGFAVERQRQVSRGALHGYRENLPALRFQDQLPRMEESQHAKAKFLLRCDWRGGQQEQQGQQ
jgi:hypothetical protein